MRLRLLLRVLFRLRRRLPRFRHTGVHQSRIGQIVDCDFDAAVRLRFGVHRRHHVHAGCRRLHFGDVRINRVDVRLALRMFEDLRHVDQIDHLLAQA